MYITIFQTTLDERAAQRSLEAAQRSLAKKIMSLIIDECSTNKGNI